MSPAPAHFKNSPRFQVWFWPVGIILFFGFLALIKSILLPFVVGMLAAYFLDPAVRKLRELHWSRSLSAAVITISFFALAIILCVILVPLISHQLNMLLQNLPDYIRGLQDKYSDDVNDYISRLSPEQSGAIKDAVSNFSGTIAGFVGKLFSDILQSGLALLNILSLIFITPVVAFYLLRDWDKLVQRLNKLLPRKNARVIRQQLLAIDRTLSGFIRGQTNVCLIMACYYSLVLSAFGLNFALGLGMLTGFLLFIPFVGIATCFVLSVTVGLFQFGANIHLLLIVLTYMVGMSLESGLITPRLVGSKVGLHPLWIIFGMLSGAALFGFVGVLISVPVTAVIGVLVRFAIAQYMKSTLYLDKPK